MKITHVIRGEEWLPSAPLHVLLYSFLGWKDNIPKFAHLPLILRPDGKGKLSKRDGEKNGFPVFPLSFKTEDGVIPGFKETGFLPSAFINMLAFLGWNPGSEKEVFSLKELIDSFSLDRVSKSGAKFDYEKTKWFNQQHIREMSNEEIYNTIQNELKGKEKTKILKIIELEKERVLFLREIINNSFIYFESFNISHNNYNYKTSKKEGDDILLSILTLLENIQDFKKDKIELLIKEFINSNNLKFGDVLPLLRFSVTGEKTGPSIYSILEIIGKKIFTHRIKLFIKNA